MGLFDKFKKKKETLLNPEKMEPISNIEETVKQRDENIEKSLKQTKHIEQKIKEFEQLPGATKTNEMAKETAMNLLSYENQKKFDQQFGPYYNRLKKYLNEKHLGFQTKEDPIFEPIFSYLQEFTDFSFQKEDVLLPYLAVKDNLNIIDAKEKKALEEAYQKYTSEESGCHVFDMGLTFTNKLYQDQMDKKTFEDIKLLGEHCSLNMSFHSKEEQKNDVSSHAKK